MADNGEPDFAVLVDQHRAELSAHCYRMLGSVHDADDAVQETLIRAWRGAAGLRDAGSARAWLYSIATNVCLTEIERRRKRALPQDIGPSVDGRTPPGMPLTESAWLDPFPSAGLDPVVGSPEARYEQRESVELAFVAAVQHLGANQRAVLMLRDVMGFSAQETAQMLETSVASVNSALQRARAAVAELAPERSQQKALQAIGANEITQLVDRYVEAWERSDVAAFAELLAQDVTFAMPPLRTWYAGREDVLGWAERFSLVEDWKWRALVTEANGQPALAFYAWDAEEQTHLPFALNVLTFGDSLVTDVTAFIVRATDAGEDDAYVRFPDQPMHRRLGDLYARFGLPARVG
jgi:RNA polymerase sigma-70 factor (ECF subfamily)